MSFEIIKPIRELERIIVGIHLVDGDIGLGDTHSDMVPPDGTPKMVIPYRGSIVARLGDREWQLRENNLYFVGNRDSPSLLRSTQPGTALIVFDFFPFGGYPLAGVPQGDAFNDVIAVNDIFAKRNLMAIDEIQETSDRKEKAVILQRILLGLLRPRKGVNPVVQYCVNTLRRSGGLASIKELERDSGYTRRYLEMQFRSQVGLPPKVLADIYRFQTIYRQWRRGQSYEDIKKDIYRYYYDQSHFAKDFKKMTGLPPQRFLRNAKTTNGEQLARYPGQFNKQAGTPGHQSQ